MTLLMTAGEFDLSVGSVFGFSPVLMWTLFNTGVLSLRARLPRRACWSRRVIGLVNGLFVTRLKIPSFLVTLGMLLVVRGTALFITDGFPQRTWSAAGQLARRASWSATSTSARSASTCRCSGSSPPRSSSATC